MPVYFTLMCRTNDGIGVPLSSPCVFRRPVPLHVLLYRGVLSDALRLVLLLSILRHVLPTLPNVSCENLSWPARIVRAWLTCFILE